MAIDLLLIVAHPDDEVYGTGGTIAETVARGGRAGLITLTRGDAGRTLGLVEPGEPLARLRDEELRASVATLGIDPFKQYAFPDGRLAEAPFDEAVAGVRADLDAWQPRVVLTFPEDGSNRHPDHIAANRIAVAALERSGLLERGTRLYYFAPPKPARPEWADTWRPATHRRDVTAFLPTKLLAISQHRSQALSTVDIIRRREGIMHLETFRRVVPPWDAAELGTELS